MVKILNHKRKILFFLLFLVAVLILAGKYIYTSHYESYPAEAAAGSTVVSSEPEWLLGSINNIDSSSASGSILIDDKTIISGDEIDISSATTSASPSANKDLVIDGNTCGTSWASSWNDPPNPPGDEGDYIQFDYGSVIEGSIRTDISDTGPTDIEYSIDGVTWNTLTWNNYCVSPSLPCDGDVTLHRMYSDVVNFRYFRIEPQGPSYFPIVVNEIAVFEKCSASATHTSGTTQIDGTTALESWDTFTPTETTPADTSIEYQFRTSDDAAAWTAWSAAEEYDGVNPIDLSGQAVERYIQVKSTLTTADGVDTPQIDDYTVNYTVTDDPCADFDHLTLAMSPSGDQADLNNGTVYSFTAQAIDTGGGTIDTNFTFTHPSVGSWNQIGTSGIAHWTTPNDLAAGDYVVTVTSDCGGSKSYTMTKQPGPEPVPPPPNVCDNFNRVEITPSSGKYDPGKKIQLSASAIKDNGSKMNYGSISYSAYSTSGGIITTSGLLTMPEPDGRVVVTATHECGSVTAVFTTGPSDCSEYGGINLVPSVITMLIGQQADFDAIAYTKSGEEYGPNKLGFSYSVNNGSVNSQGIYTAPNTPGTTDTITVTDSCGGTDSSKITIKKSPKLCEGGQLDFESPNGIWNNEHTTYLVYTKTTEVFGEEKPNFEIIPKLTLAKQGDVTNRTKFNFQKLSPSGASFINQVFYPGITNGIARAQVSAIADGCYYNVMIKFVLAGPGPDPICGLFITKPEKDDQWQINTREEITWQSEYLDDWINSVDLDYSTDNGNTWQPIVEDYPNTQSYDWKIPNDQNLVTNKAKIRITAKSSLRNEVADDLSDTFKIIGKEQGIAALLPSMTPELRTQLAAQGPLVGLMMLGLLWPYLIGALDRNRFFSDIANFFSYLIQEGQYLLHIKQRPKKWGVAYDYEDKLPLSYAKVMLFDKKTDRLKQTYITNNKGEFGFLVEPGDYYVNIQKSGYILGLKTKEAPKTNPMFNEDGSTKIGKDRDIWRAGASDGYYSNLYFGQIIAQNQVNDPKKKTSVKQSLKLSMPLIATERTWINVLLSFLRKISSFFHRFRIPILIVGTIIAIYLLIAQRGITDLIVFAIYIIFWLIELMKSKEIRGYAQIIDNQNKSIGLAIIRVFNNKGKLVQTQVTGQDGKFILACQPQKLLLKVRKPGFKVQKVRFNLRNLDDISKLNIKLNPS